MLTLLHFQVRKQVKCLKVCGAKKQQNEIVYENCSTDACAVGNGVVCTSGISIMCLIQITPTHSRVSTDMTVCPLSHLASALTGSGNDGVAWSEGDRETAVAAPLAASRLFGKKFRTYMRLGCEGLMSLQLRIDIKKATV